MVNGQKCQVSCSGSDTVVGGNTHATCSAGEVLLCSDASCGTTSSATAPCSAGTAASGFSSELTTNLQPGGARRLSATGLEAQLADQIEGVLAAFKTAMATTLGISADKITIEGHSLFGRDDGSVDLVISFFVEAEEGSDIQAKLTELATGGGGTLAATLKAQFQSELASVPGVSVTVGDVTISAPEKATIYVEEGSSGGGGGGDDDEGGGGAAIIAVVVVVVLVVVGLVVWKFVLKK